MNGTKKWLNLFSLLLMLSLLTSTLITSLNITPASASIVEKNEDGRSNAGSSTDAPLPYEYCSTPNLPIPDNTPAGVTNSLYIPNLGTLNDLNVIIYTSHTWVGDLIFTLEHINTGNTVTLIDRPGVPASTFGCSGNDIAATIDDEGMNGNVEDTCLGVEPTIQGSLVGGDPPSTSLLEAFDGEALSGMWALTVSDNAGGDTGTLDTWCLEATINPTIVATPPTLSDTLEPNTSITHTLVISNVGSITLTWTITEEIIAPLLPIPVTDLPSGSGSTPPAIPGAEQEEADTAVSIVPQDADEKVPAIPYAYPEAVLYDNGPLVNCPGCGVGGADESILQNTSLSMNTFGFGHQASSGNRIADEFTISDTEGWLLHRVTFFAYQTGSSTASTMTAVNLRIWDGPPGVAGSNVIWGDTTTNLLIYSSWANIYRVSETTTGANADRPIMANIAHLGGLYLPQGTYWLDWQTDGSLTSGPWAPPITINGQAVTGNALQYTGAWAPANDNGTGTQQGFPFIIEGEGPCIPTDIPWASIEPLSGEVSPGGANPLTVTFDATGLAEGAYTGDLCITSNDPNRHFLRVPLELVVHPIPVLESVPTEIEVGVTLGNVLTKTLVINNTGSGPYDFTLQDFDYGYAPPTILASPATTCPADAFGYTCTDSTEPDGLVSYNFEDITAIGTPIVLSDDEVSAALPLGFNFSFYGQVYTQTYASSNGFLAVLPGQGSGCCTGDEIPYPGNPNGVIAGWWEDLDPGEVGADLRFATLGSAPFRRFIFQYTNVQHFPSGTPVTFQIKLFETSGNIEIHYLDAASDGGTHSAGIENHKGVIGSQYYHDTAGLGASLAVCFLYPGMQSCGSGVDAPWVYQIPYTGTVDTGAALPIDVIFDTSMVAATGTYSAGLHYRGTFENPATPTPLIMHVINETFSIDLEKTVGTDAGTCASTDSITVVDGTQVTYCYRVTNTGELTHNIHDLVDSELGDILVDFNYDLAPGASVFVTQTITILADTTNQATWYAANGPFVAEANDSATVNTIPAVYGVELSTDQALTGLAGEVVVYTLHITNIGNVADTFNLSFSGNTWSVTLPVTQITLAAGASTDFTVHVNVPSNGVIGDDDTVTILATSQGDAGQTDSAMLTTTLGTFDIYMPVLSK